MMCRYSYIVIRLSLKKESIAIYPKSFPKVIFNCLSMKSYIFDGLLPPKDIQ